MIPQGKGMFIWQLANCAGGDPNKLAQKAKEADFRWVTIKVCNGYAEYQTPMLGKAIDALRKESIHVHGWGYVYGYSNWQAVEESKVMIKQMKTFNLDGFMIDAESEYKYPGRSVQAETYMHAIRSALPDTSLGLCSYRFPSYHPQLPWTSFLSHCDYHNPQVYWEGAHNPDQQLRKSVTELLALKDLPVVPIGSAYSYGSWNPTPADLDEFYATVIDLKLQSWSWWSWQHAEAVKTWWDRISDHENPGFIEFPLEFPEVLTLEQRVTRLEKEARAHGWNI